MTITNFQSAVLVARQLSPATPGYVATSATSIAIGTGTISVTTQAGLAYVPGQRVRMISAANVANYQEGIVSSYSASTMGIIVSRIGPTATGTHSDWSIVVAGDPGAGDLLSTNNLADLTNLTTAVSNLGLSAVLTNARLAKTGAYTVLNTDKGKTIALGGVAFYALTFGAASGYDANFTTLVLNEDTGRAKWIAPNGLLGFYLWPGQSVIVFNQNNVWQVHGRSRYKLPTGLFIVNTNYGVGSDTLGVSDGLATGAGAFQSYQHGLNFTLDQFDWNGTESGQTQLKILGAPGNVDGTQIHFSPHGNVGAQGGAAITIDGNGGSLIVSGVSGAIQLYFGAVLQIRNINIQTGGGVPSNCIDLLWGSKLYIQDLVTFTQNTTGGACLNVADGAHVEFDNGFTWAQSGGTFITNNGGYIRVSTAILGTVTNNITVTNTVFGFAPGITDLANITWSLGGHTVTATNKYNIQGAHVLTGSANVPGSGVGITPNGGIAL
jgi:hypothetical protein